MKTVLITGGNSGIGRATAQALAAQGFRVFIAARDMAKSEQVLAAIAAAVPGAQVAALQLDLADLDQVRAFAADFRQRVPVLDVLLLPSANEGTPVVAMEALAARKPVVATRVGSVPDVVSDGEDGFLVPVGEVDQLASSLERLARADAL